MLLQLLLLFTHVCQVTGACRCFAFQIGMIRQIFYLADTLFRATILVINWDLEEMHMARDMTKGNITGHLIAYAVPLVLEIYFSSSTIQSIRWLSDNFTERSIGGGRRGGSDHEYPDFSNCGTVTRRIDFDGKLLWSKRLPAFER